MAGRRDTTHNRIHTHGAHDDARKYVCHVIGRIPGLAGLAPIQELLKLQQSCSPSARDAIVLRAIWIIRSHLAQGSELSWLVSRTHERLPRTRKYLDAKFDYSNKRKALQPTRPFCHDGIDWHVASRTSGANWLAAFKELGIDFDPKEGFRYLNSFDHAMTALIVCGWGLSGSCTCDGTGWKPNTSIATLWDGSITLSLFEALSALSDASRAQERGVCEQAIEEILALRERGDWHQVPKAAYDRLDQLIEMES